MGTAIHHSKLASQDEALAAIEEELALLYAQQQDELLELEKDMRSSNLELFVPNPGGQTTFFEKSALYLRAVFSGNRFGKSTAGIVEDCCWLLGYRPFFPVGDPRRTLGIPEHGVKGLLLAETWEKVRDIFCREGDPAVDDQIGKLFHFMPSDAIDRKKTNQHGIISQIEIVNTINGRPRRSVLIFDTVRSFLTNKMGKESSDWDFIHVDEPIPRELWEAVSRGLIDRGGKSWWLMTPISEPWMYHFATDMAATKPHECWVYQGDSDENLTLGEEEKSRFFDSLSDDAKKARKMGIPLALSRLVLSNFDPERHVRSTTPAGWKDRFTPPPDWMICAATDPHQQTPHATLKVAISPLGEVIVYNERFKKGALAGPEGITGWLKDSPEHPQMNYYLLDPVAWNEDQTTGRRFVDDFYEDGLDPVRGSKKRSENNILMNDFLGNKKKFFQIMDHCTVLLNEIQLWYFDKDDKPVDKNDHCIECLVRLRAHDNFTYRRPYSAIPTNPPGDFYGDGDYQMEDTFSNYNAI